MEPIRIKPDEFKLTNFINYYNDNYEELLFDYPSNISRICLVDKDYMDVITFDEDYEELNDAFKSADFNKIMNISTQIQTTVNSTNEKMKSIEDKLSTLLNENPGFNQTLQDLNISDKNYLSNNIPNPFI